MLSCMGISLGEDAAFLLLHGFRAMLICPNGGVGGAEWALSCLKESFPPDGTGRKNKLLGGVTKAPTT